MVKKIDCLGDFCPIPSIKAKHAFKDLRPGEKIIITSDHSCSPSNIKDVLVNNDCSINVEEIVEGIWEITIEKLS